MKQITNLQQLEILQSNTLVYAAIVTIIALLIVIGVANMIPYKGGIDRSYVKRRVAYILIGIFTAIGFFLYNDLVVKANISNAGFQTMFEKTNLTCLAITIGGYAIVGIGIMLLFRYSKFGSILGKIKSRN